MRAPEPPGLAILHYRSADYEIMRPGHYVLCAVSAAVIPLGELLYWSADRQEAYRGPEEATRALTGASDTLS